MKLVEQSDSVTPGHPVAWVTNGVIADAGPPTQSTLTGVGVTNSGPGFVQNSGSIFAPYYQFVMGVTADGVGTISLNGYGGAINASLVVEINGTLYPFPSGGSGNVTGPGSSTVGYYAVWNSIDGTLLAAIPPPPIANATTIATLNSTSFAASIAAVQLAGYYAAGDSGAALYSRIATPSPAKAWHQQSADGAWWQLAAPIVNPYQLGAKGDNSTDDFAAFQHASDYAAALVKELRILKGSYALSAQVVTTVPINITCDNSSDLRWTNSASSGWLFDFRSTASNPGLTTINLPNMFSSAMDSGFNYPGYPSSWTGTARLGSAVTLWGGSRININVHYIVGWLNGFNLAATFDVTNGARNPENINATVNTIDLCVNGIYLDGGPSGASVGIGPVTVTANTVFAKFPILLNSATNPVFEANVNITGQAFTNEAGGAGIYDPGVQTNTSYFQINWLYAGYASDSPSGTSSSLTLPFLAGASTSNGSLTDGNATVGYFGGFNNEFDVGLAAQLQAFPGGSLPAPSIVTRIRDAGVNNKVNVRYYPQQLGSATVLSSTQGESHFGGGVGAAGISRKILCSAAVSNLAPGAFTAFYFYHTFLSEGSLKPISVVGVNSLLAVSGFSYSASDNAVNVNREGILIIQNSTQGTLTGGTFTFWIIIDE